jgi:rare lipoprotein A
MRWRHQGRGLAPALRAAFVVLAGLALANCAASSKFAAKVDPKYGVETSPRVAEAGKPIPKGGGTYRVGKPYVVAGRTYVPEENIDYSAEGLASWYGDDFHGRLTANGEIYDMHAISAAHPTLPMPSYVRVTNLRNKRSIVARVNDRGPFHGNRIIDLSAKTAKLLGFHGDGLARVRVEYIGRAPLEGSDDRKLVATLRHRGPAPAPSAVRVAAAKDFVPELESPLARRRGPLPVPPDRPFAAPGAAGPPRLAAGGTTDLTASARAPRQELHRERPQPPAPAAFAATASAPPAAFMSSGRGLY